MPIAIKEIIAGALKPAAELIDSLSTSREEKDAAKIKLAAIMNEAGEKFNQAQASVIIAEATGESWIQRNWRPITMLTFVFIVAWNYVLGPIGTWGADLVMDDGPEFPILDLPVGLWGTIATGIGGYMTLRTYEKVKLGKEK